MISIRKKTKVSSDLFNLFKKEGKVLTYEEYIRRDTVPLRLINIQSQFGSYGKLLNTLRLKHAAEWEEMEDSFKTPTLSTKVEKLDTAPTKVDPKPAKVAVKKKNDE
jgi:hypothetical protein